MFSKEELDELRSEGVLFNPSEVDFDGWFEKVCQCSSEHFKQNAESLKFEFIPYYEEGIPAFVAAIEMFCQRAD